MPGLANSASSAGKTADAVSSVTDFLATSDGLCLVKAFMLVEDPKLRLAIVRLVEEIAPATGEFGAPAADDQDN
jgi:hypothetical protein